MEKWGQPKGSGAGTGLGQAVVLSEGTRIWLSALSEIEEEKYLLVRTRANSGLRTANPRPCAEARWETGSLLYSVVGRGVLDLLHTFKALLSEETLIITAAQQAWPAGLLIRVMASFFFFF